MTRLGRSLWDDPNYVLGTILPDAIGYNLGSANLPFRDLFLDGSIIYSSGAPGNLDSVAAVTALGTNQATAAPTTATINYVSGADSAKGVSLEDVPTGGTVVVNNTSATNYLNVYPEAAGSAFEGLGNGLPIILGPGGTLTAHRVTATKWTASGISGWYTDLATKQLAASVATAGIQLLAGSNGRTGTFTLNGATPVVISNTSLTANDQIIITRDTIGGTPLDFHLTARTNGTGFSVTGTATDTSGMRYSLIRINT